MSMTKTSLVGAAIAMGIVLSVICYLRNSLLAILTELCGRTERARFWSSFSHVTLFLIALIALLNRGPELPYKQSGIFAIYNQIQAGMTGLVGSVLTLGVVLSVYMARYFIPEPAHPDRAENGGHA
jgi:hypothetical protein